MTDGPGERTLHLLLVEDDDGDARLLEETLSEARLQGVELHRATALEPAVRHLESSPVDLVLLDLDLPDARGLESLKRTLEADGTRPVVILTGLEDRQLALRALREGAQEYLVKGSFDPETLERVLRYSIERKRAEREAARTRRIYRAVFEHAPIGMAVVDSDLQVAEANRALCEMLGYSREELLGTPFPEFTHQEDSERDVRLFRRLFAGEIEEYAIEKRYVTRDGRVIWGSLVVSAVTGDEQRPSYVLGMVQDITDRVEAEESHRRLAAILESTPDVVGMCDPDGKVLWVNRPGKEMLGIPAEEDLTGVDIDRFSPDWAAELIREEGIPAAVERGFWRGETALVGRDEGEIPVSQMILAHRAESGELEFLSTLARDISAEKESRKALQESEERLSRVLETVAEGIAIVDPEGRFTYANPGARHILGRDEEDLIGSTYRDERWDVTIGEGATRSPDDYVYRQVLESGRPVRGTVLQLEHDDRGRIIVSLNAAPLRDRTGEATGVVISLRDVTEQKRFEEELEERALYDGLTGLPNRALFWDRLQHAVQRSGRNEQRFAVLFADLDRFKTVNDSLGHDAGDRALMETARRIRRCFRDQDTVARIGGDEFTVLMEDTGDAEQVRAAAERLVAEFDRPFRIHGETFRIHPSVGVAIWSTETETADDIVRQADTAMYRARGTAGIRVHLFDPEADMEQTARLQKEARLHSAVETRDIVVYYQPIVSLEEGRIVGVESLARWRDPERGLISATDFIPLAEETGLIISLGQQLMRESCRHVVDWSDDGRELELFVNLSAHQFDSPELIPFVEELLEETGIRPSCLTMEITERLIMQSAERLDRIKELGVRVAVDDFGTGYSSLAYLRRLNVDALKIDRFFVSGVDRNLPDEAIVRTIMTLGDTLGLTVTAEGIEEERQAARLRALGCPRGQGFYFARPMPAGEFESLLSEDVTLPAP